MEGRIAKGRVLLKDTTETQDKTDSGIYMAVVDSRQRTGEVVISAGEDVKVGDKVVFISDGFPVNLDGERYKLLRESEILYIY